MPARDKYTIFTPHARGYRKGIHKVPKWTRVRTDVSPVLPSAHFRFLANPQDQPERLLALLLYTHTELVRTTQLGFFLLE
jgi:Mitochondrial ribosomal protein L31